MSSKKDCLECPIKKAGYNGSSLFDNIKPRDLANNKGDVYKKISHIVLNLYGRCNQGQCRNIRVKALVRAAGKCLGREES